MFYFIEKQIFKAGDVEALLKIADFGPDYETRDVSTNRRKCSEDIAEDESATNETLVKTNNVLGVNREAIINQVRGIKNDWCECHSPTWFFAGHQVDE